MYYLKKYLSVEITTSKIYSNKYSVKIEMAHLYRFNKFYNIDKEVTRRNENRGDE